MQAHWVIYKDYLAAESNLPQFNPQTGNVKGLAGMHKAVEIWGPRNSGKPDRNMLNLDFIIADDDGNVYYRGMADEQAEFQPLDMFGTPNAGATMIAYKRDGKWDVL